LYFRQIPFEVCYLGFASVSIVSTVIQEHEWKGICDIGLH
jgi:hypothetical protein